MFSSNAFKSRHVRYVTKDLGLNSGERQIFRSLLLDYGKSVNKALKVRTSESCKERDAKAAGVGQFVFNLKPEQQTAFKERVDALEAKAASREKQVFVGFTLTGFFTTMIGVCAVPQGGEMPPIPGWSRWLFSGVVMGSALTIDALLYAGYKFIESVGSKAFSLAYWTRQAVQSVQSAIQLKEQNISLNPNLATRSQSPGPE
ncbi:Uncharacterised protein [uncultured archaeon]|nr:Uncharacterised protein [uncultured archaeon]